MIADGDVKHSRPCLALFKPAQGSLIDWRADYALNVHLEVCVGIVPKGLEESSWRQFGACVLRLFWLQALM